MKKLTGRPSETTELPVLENDIRIFLNSDDMVIYTTAGRPKKTGIEQKILDFLQTNPRSTTSDVCRGIGKDSVSSWTSTNKILNRLEKKEFVKSADYELKTLSGIKGKTWIKTDKEWNDEEKSEDGGKTKKKYKYHHALYIGDSLPPEKWAFKEETNAGRGTYLKTKFYPRSAIVIVHSLQVSGRKYINIPAGTQMFFTEMNENGVLSSIGEDFSGQPVTIIVNPPGPETIRVYEENETFTWYIKPGRSFGKTASIEKN